MTLQEALDEVHHGIATSIGKGRVASYIPALARVDPRKFGLAAVGVDGEMAQVGDARESFSIQSVSKVFTLTLALGKVGEDLWRRVGREPSGSAFNSIVQLEHEHGKPRNPLINAGAIVVTDILLRDATLDDTTAEILAFVRGLADDPGISIDTEVAESERDSSFRNRSLANFMKSFGSLTNSVEDALAVYVNQCSISMSCVQLARAGLFLAGRGRDPIAGRQVVSARRARRIAAIMLTCGHYDASGDFAFRVGLPGKSGVGGGILAIAPGRASIAAWSPGLNAQGNSLVGTLALERLAAITGCSVF